MVFFWFVIESKNITGVFYQSTKNCNCDGRLFWALLISWKSFAVAHVNLSFSGFSLFLRCITLRYDNKLFIVFTASCTLCENMISTKCTAMNQNKVSKLSKNNCVIADLLIPSTFYSFHFIRELVRQNVKNNKTYWFFIWFIGNSLKVWWLHALTHNIREEINWQVEIWHTTKTIKRESKGSVQTTYLCAVVRAWGENPLFQWL